MHTISVANFFKYGSIYDAMFKIPIQLDPLKDLHSPDQFLSQTVHSAHLLAGGDKSTQEKDIQTALKLARSL